MASGSFSGSGSYVSLKISWSSTKGTGGSTVNATLYAVNNSSAYFYATVNQGYNIYFKKGNTILGSKGGTTATLSTSANGTATLLSHSIWVAYTGDYSITISGDANMSNIYCNNAPLGNRSVSGTAVLDKVGEKPPVPTVSAPTTSTISETATSITIAWAKSSDYSGKATYTVQVSKNGSTYANIATGIANATTSYTYTITAGQGNTYKFRVCAVNDVGSSDYSESGLVTTNSISEPTIGTIATYNPYVGNLTISHTGGSQTNGEAFSRYCHIYYDYGGDSQKYIGACNIPTNTTTTLTMTTNDTIKSNVLSVLGTTKYSSNKFSAVCWNQNSNGSMSTRKIEPFTININTDGGANPTLATPTLSGGYGDYKSTCFVVGRHNVTVTSGSASTNRALSGTTLSYKISCTGANNVNSSTATFSGLTAGKKTITVTVTDSRGLSTSKTVYCRYQTWAKPTVTITKAERNETTTTTINVEYSINYTPIYAYSAGADDPGAQLNSIINQHYSTGNAYAQCTSPLIITGADTERSYNITIRVGDKFVAIESDYGYAIKTVGSIKVYIAAREHGLGLNCVPDSGYRLHINGSVKLGNANEYIAMAGGSLSSTGNVSVGGALNTTSSITSASSLISNGGVVELFGENPYIDFHYDNDADDYTSRLIANKSGELTCVGGFKSTGTINSDVIGSVLGYTRFDNDWIGMYPTHADAIGNTNRKGWIGHNDSNDLHIKNEKGGYIKFVTSGKVLGIAPDSNGYMGFSGEGDVVRTPVKGLLPNAESNTSDIGADTWRFQNGYFVNMNASGTVNIDKLVIGTSIDTKSGSTFICSDARSDENRISHMRATYGSTKYVEVVTPHHSTGVWGINMWSSDKSLKDNIKDTEVRHALDKISKLKHVEFDWNDSTGHVDLGYVADDVEQVLPCLTFDVKQTDGSNLKHINHTTMIPLVTMGMQELIEEKDLLWEFDNAVANEIIALQNKVDNLEKQIEELKALV